MYPSPHTYLNTKIVPPVVLDPVVLRKEAVQAKRITEDNLVKFSRNIEKVSGIKYQLVNFQSAAG